MDIQRAEIGATSRRQPLPRRRQDRLTTAFGLPKNNLAGSGAQSEGAQIVAVEAAQFCTKRVIAKANLGLFKRTGENDVEAYDPGASLNRRGNHASDVARPSESRRAFEWRVE